jgi:intracellular multiplication protein IcmX
MRNFVSEFNPQGASNAASPAAKALGNQTASSEALNEFLMASWRLFDSNNDAGSMDDSSKQWLSKINKGSTASVQKEIAVLLAEINYQMYLTRQQNERMLLTQSIMLLQAARSALPSNQLTQTSSDATTSSGNIP